jgi:hypothetical protein
MSDQQPKNALRPTPRGDFETVKLAATNLEEKRISGDREKTKMLKAARLLKVENEKSSLK